jgi:RimJ/RimL family protein N-acetyltransferase
MVRRPAERVIGDVVLHYSSHPHKQGEIGCVLNPDYHGQGFASEAARALLELGFQVLALHRIAARCDARNVASLRVMERLGMTREAPSAENEFLQGEWTDESVYAIREDTWRAQPGGP